MEFKIDTKETFAIISPIVALLNEYNVQELAQKCNDVRQNGSANIIISLSQVPQMDASVPSILEELHHMSYNNEESLVFTEYRSDVLKVMKQSESDLILNLAPRMQEAIDIISMEILERDLWDEEEL
jgi:anti-anti-sigma regulatory factor